MTRNRIPGIAFILLALTVMGCDKYNLTKNKEMILGTWISLDESDTLDIVDESRFYKTVGTMPDELFHYELFVDSIEIAYSGSLYILVYPTKHKYSIDENKLIIDFRNKKCYGFGNRETVFLKQ